VKTAIIALFAAALIATAPAVLARGASAETPGLQHKVAKTHHAKTHHAGVSGHARPREKQVRGAGKGYPGAFGYAPAESRGYLDRDLEVSGRQAGGGNGM